MYFWFPSGSSRIVPRPSVSSMRGTGVGILLLAPLSEWLLSTWGWPRAFQTFSGIVLLLLFPLVWIFYQHGPFGERLRSKKESKPNEHRWTAKLALRSWQFWLLFFARICAASGTTVIVTHQVGPCGRCGLQQTTGRDDL